MKCYNHPDTDAVDTCTMCRKPMCAECRLDYDGKIVCKPCAMPLVNFFAPMVGCGGSHPAEPAASDHLLERLQKTVRGRVADVNLSPLEDEARKFILKWIARTGKPPAYEDIRGGLGISSIGEVKPIVAKLHTADILFEKNGKIISAYPFSTVESRHRIIFNDGHAVYALCAIDALGAHFMLGEDITIESTCPECNEELKIRMRNGHIVSQVPNGIVVYLSNEDDCGRVVQTCCPFINFFCSEVHLDQWKWENPRFKNGEHYALGEALEYGNRIFGDLLSEP